MKFKYASSAIGRNAFHEPGFALFCMQVHDLSANSKRGPRLRLFLFTWFLVGVKPVHASNSYPLNISSVFPVKILQDHSEFTFRDHLMHTCIGEK